MFQFLMQLRHRQASTVARPVAPKGTHKAQRPVEKPVEFILRQPQARSVAVAGDFNNWEASRTPMKASPEGSWKATVWLPAGRYEYRFVVDGEWCDDPLNPMRSSNALGAQNCVLIVEG